MSLIAEFRQFQEASREECYAEIISELKAQIGKNPYTKYYVLHVRLEAEDIIVQRLVNDGLNAKPYMSTGNISELRVSIPSKV